MIIWDDSHAKLVGCEDTRLASRRCTLSVPRECSFLHSLELLSSGLRQCQLNNLYLWGDIAGNDSSSTSCWQESLCRLSGFEGRKTFLIIIIIFIFIIIISIMIICGIPSAWRHNQVTHVVERFLSAVWNVEREPKIFWMENRFFCRSLHLVWS